MQACSPSFATSLWLKRYCVAYSTVGSLTAKRHCTQPTSAESADFFVRRQKKNRSSDVGLRIPGDDQRQTAKSARQSSPRGAGGKSLLWSQTASSSSCQSLRQSRVHCIIYIVCIAENTPQIVLEFVVHLCPLNNSNCGKMAIQIQRILLE